MFELNDSHICLPSRSLWGLEIVGPDQADQPSAAELHNHMTKGDEEGIGKVVVLRGEHPLVVQGQKRRKAIPIPMSEVVDGDERLTMTR